MTRRLLSLLLAFAAGACVALLSVGGSIAVSVHATPDPSLTDLRFSAPAGPALTADHLAAKVAPVLQKRLIEAKEDIVAASGGPLTRTAVRLAFPIGVREVPVATEHGTKAILDEFGHYSLSDLATLIEHHLSTRDEAPAQGSDRLLSELRAARARPAR